MEYKKEIETPIGKHKVIIKTMLTGGERERVTNAPMQYAKTNDGKTFTVDTEKVATAEKDMLLTVSVVSIDGDGTDTLARLKKMYEVDYDFVYNQVVESQKKIKEPISPTSS